MKPTKNYTVYSDNLKMNTAPLPDTSLPGYAGGGIVLGDRYMELMDSMPRNTQEALVRKAAQDKRYEEMRAQAEQEEKRRKPKAE